MKKTRCFQNKQQLSRPVQRLLPQQRAISTCLATLHAVRTNRLRDVLNNICNHRYQFAHFRRRVQRARHRRLRRVELAAFPTKKKKKIGSGKGRKVNFDRELRFETDGDTSQNGARQMIAATTLQRDQQHSFDKVKKQNKTKQKRAYRMNDCTKPASSDNRSTPICDHNSHNCNKECASVMIFTNSTTKPRHVRHARRSRERRVHADHQIRLVEHLSSQYIPSEKRTNVIEHRIAILVGSVGRLVGSVRTPDAQSMQRMCANAPSNRSTQKPDT